MNNINIYWNKYSINNLLREIHHKHKSFVLWFTGLSGSGKSTIANYLEKEFYMYGISTYLLDGDNIRHGLCKDLSFSKLDRKENIRRVSEVIKLMIDSGLIVLSTFISPYKKDRKIAKNIIGYKRFFEIFIDTSLKTCELRDPKGLYKKAKNGKILDFTGVNSLYEKPNNPDIYINGEKKISNNVKKIFLFLKNKIFF